MTNIVFIAENESYIQDTKTYYNIWKNEQEKILTAIKKISLLSFEENSITAIVYEGVSFSGKNTLSPMKLRASYPFETKKATLIHELLHRLLFRIKKRLNYGEHQILNLILYDIWNELYGKKFAVEQVEVESKRKGLFDYRKTWKQTLNMTKEMRQQEWIKILSINSLMS